MVEGNTDLAISKDMFFSHASSKCLPNGAFLYTISHKLKNMSSYESMNVRLKELTGQLDQKDTELDQEVDDIIETD